MNLPGSQTRWHRRCQPQSAVLRWLAIWLLLLPLVCGCQYRGQPNPADRPVPANRVLDFGLLYRANCSACHGPEGKLGPAPPLNDPLFVEIVPDAELERLVTAGRPGTPMPGFSRDHGGPLTDDQVRILARGIKSRWPSSTELVGGSADKSQQGDKPHDSAGKTNEDEPNDQTADAGGAATAGLPPYFSSQPADHVASEAELHEGRELFARACAGCHGRSGGGGDMAGAIHVPAFLSLISDQALRRLIITGRPDLGMPTYAQTDGRPDDFKPLTSSEIDAIVALLASWREEKSTPAAADTTDEPAARQSARR